MSFPERNIYLTNTEQSQPYVSNSSFGNSNYPERQDRKKHADFLEKKLKKCYELSNAQKQAVAIKYKDGTYLEFLSAPDFDLSSKEIENRNDGIRLLKVDTDNLTNTTRALVYIPEGKQAVFLKKIEQYATKNTPKGNPSYNNLIRSIDDIQLAIAKSFWTGNVSDFPNKAKIWCEVWLRYNDENDYDNIHNAFEECCKFLNIEFRNEKIKFPERSVRLIRANNQDLTNLINANENIAELRKAIEPANFFTDLSANDQKGVINNILSRVTFNDSNTSVCIFDTGINKDHKLLNSAIANNNAIQAYDPSWGNSDDEGHGTEMAGVALYNNLSDLFESNEQITINYKLESVKILPPKGQNNKCELYGAITEQSVYLAEIANPNSNRVICMAVTSDDSFEDGHPTSWSAAIDSITSSANDKKSSKKLFIVSAGNVNLNDFKNAPYPQANKLYSVEDPGQSWNAITVGGYTNSITITDQHLKGFKPLADVGELSPYSSTSVTWDKKWPIKPEILLDGGNIATNGTDFFEATDTDLLTTGNDLLNRPISTIGATSGATAQATLIAAKIYSEYPKLWPETVRALMIHSARWTSNMKKQFDVDEAKKSSKTSLLRSCGYGIPNLEKALYCLNNQVNLVIESELQPYKNGNMNEMHLHQIPWPSNVLLELGETPATLRITLSYFIEPGPGEVGWKDKYRYASCALRFDVINSNENVENFCKRINVKMRGEDKKDKGDGSPRNWYLGANNRDVGSIHSDFCKTTAADLANANYIAVYPVVGWWKERKHLGKSNEKIRYSLIVSIETPETETDLYTPIVNQITNTVDTPTEI